VNFLCKLLLWSFLCCLLATPIKAQEGGLGQPAHHHPPQDQLLHEKFYSTWQMPDNPMRSCCNNADCYPTESNTSTARSMRGEGKTGSTYSSRPRRSSETEIIPTAEITFARHRRPSLRWIRSTASHWEAPREVHPGEWQDSLPQDVLHAVLREDQQQLSARDQVLIGVGSRRRSVSQAIDLPIDGGGNLGV